MLFLQFQARDIIPTIEANLPDEESNLKDEPNQNFDPNQNSEPLEDDFNDNFIDQDPDPPDSAPEDILQDPTSKPVQKTSKSAKKSKKSSVKLDPNTDQEEVQCYYCCVMISRSEIESHMRNDHGRYSGMDCLHTAFRFYVKPDFM